MRKRISETMRKIKIILMIVCLLILSGCTATYEININDDKIIEKLRLIETNTTIFDKETDTGWTLRETFQSLLDNDDEFSKSNYKVKSLNNDNQLGVEYSSSSSESVLNSSILNQCYTNPKVNVVDDVITIDTGNDFKCYEYYENLETVKVVLKTNHKVISTNADEQNGDTYIWNFSKDSNKSINVSYYKSDVKKSVNIKGIVIVLCIVSFIGIVSYFVLKKMKKSNEI